MADRDPLDDFALPTVTPATSKETAESPTASTESTDSEFAGWMSELGAQRPSDVSSELDLKDMTIAALREMLEGLRPLGEQLADSEQRRLELEVRLEAAVCATHIERTSELEVEVSRLKRALVQAQANLKKVRARSAERQRVATQRWREIQKLRSERTRLASELRKLGRSSQVDDTD